MVICKIREMGCGKVGGLYSFQRCLVIGVGGIPCLCVMFLYLIAELLVIV